MIGAIWAHAHGVIGADGDMPWYLPEDLAHFKSVTMSSAVLMGRATWQSLSERFRPLPRRENFVATKNPEFSAPGARLVTDLDGFLSDPRWQDEDLWVMGGGEIYRAAMPVIDRASVTEIDVRVAGDTFAPELPSGQYHCGPWQKSARGLSYRFCDWTRAALHS
ncbi:dihydrofolate reductase [Bowdeniella nasicola]|uniref:dihydrofolate reductase n=1 Tax=Bowdeniella nasicola TaxID=208480 RepID=A0A1H4DJS8_9ACTO|nr:dihydrofolate reductase [Bowdeniella nasicola]SEA72788.1 dihydrofolate reductase [Bowdeniella nasicola]